MHSEADDSTSHPAGAVNAADGTPPEAPDAVAPTDTRPDPFAGRSTARLDARSLRAVAHPRRLRMLGELRRHGPSTATRLAAKLGINTGSASYHLRQLADVGLVAEDPAEGTSRERWWRAAHEMTRFDDRELLVQEPEASMAYIQAIESFYTARLRSGVEAYQDMPREWQQVFTMSDVSLRLTLAEGEQLRDELAEVLARYRWEDPNAPREVPADAEYVSAVTLVLPEPAPREDAEGGAEAQDAHAGGDDGSGGDARLAPGAGRSRPPAGDGPER
ncbi:ArsR/SmtB family transcription factor [Streptomyces bohaiensis]|uniref:Helix-turn-helix domain-containing protein n=1 Tax=Streptomyces bohaiensis TaxID=1431344 RepID=A0ABX1CGM3_9ACTN|nr:helix-turn-helix domain-containing protein [Streptomyces bohaiensis]NJQ16602.1 helix-turn-helix domain-containing protein [Streptomyces bohaiensis]